MSTLFLFMGASARRVETLEDVQNRSSLDVVLVLGGWPPSFGPSISR